MPEKPGSFSCSQCGHIIVEITSGKCQNCGHLFDQRQFKRQKDESLGSRYKASGRRHTEKPIQEIGKPLLAASETVIETICPQCKSNINSTDVINKKCPLCGYIGLMTPRQTRKPGQATKISQEKANIPAEEPAIPESSQKSPESLAKEIIPGSDSSELIDVAPKDWKQAKPDKKIPRSKKTDKFKEWEGESTNKNSFASLLLGVRNFTDNSNKEFPLNRVIRITGSLLLIAIIVFGLINIIPMLFSSESSSTVPQIDDAMTKISIVDVANRDITHSSAQISWTTNIQVTSRFEYGITKTYGIVESLDNLTEQHSISLHDLEPNTSYYYKITIIDKDGNEAVHEASQPFTTNMLPDTTPPAILAVIVAPSGITDVSAIISWELDDEEAESYVEYGKSELYDKKKLPKKESANIRTAILSGLEPNTTYQFRINSEDTHGNKAEPYAGIPFTTHAPVPTGTKVGDRAPDFSLEYFTTENLPQAYVGSGGSVNLSDFRGKVVIVNFWSISCGACIAEMPDFQEVFNNSNKNELIVLAIHTKQYRSRIERYLEKTDWSLPILLDTNGVTSRDYKITRIPRTFFIDAGGTIQKVKLGRFNSPSEIEDILENESLLGSKP
jgi:thiol-disulfide isomerase/thioredoxin